MKFDDTIPFKIDTDTKTAFQAAVEQDGETVSIVLRRLVREYLRSRPISLTSIPASENIPAEQVAA